MITKLTAHEYPFEYQQNDECSIHAFNNIVALASHEKLAEKRAQVPINPITAELALEACRIAKASFAEFRNDSDVVCSKLDVHASERSNVTVENTHRVQTVFMFYEIWNLCNPEMPRLRITDPLMHDHVLDGEADLDIRLAERNSDYKTASKVADMFADDNVIGAHVGVIVLGNVEHYAAVVRTEEGFLLVDSMHKRGDKRHSTNVNGLRDEIKSRKMPFVKNAGDIHGMVMKLYPGIKNLNSDTDPPRRTFPNKPTYSFVFTDDSSVWPWYKEYTRNPNFAEVSEYLMPDKDILWAFSVPYDDVLRKYTNRRSFDEFMTGLAIRLGIERSDEAEVQEQIRKKVEYADDSPYVYSQLDADGNHAAKKPKPSGHLRPAAEEDDDDDNDFGKTKTGYGGYGASGARSTGSRSRQSHTVNRPQQGHRPHQANRPNRPHQGQQANPRRNRPTFGAIVRSATAGVTAW